MKKKLKQITVLGLMLAFVCGARSVRGELEIQPTATPNIVYIVITATPELQEELDLIQAPTADPNEALIANIVATLQAANSAAEQQATQSAAVQKTVTAMTSASSIVAAAEAKAQTNGVEVVQSDGSVCTMAFSLVNEPNYSGIADMNECEIYWKEWTIQNTGTCTWTPDFHFKFSKGWQIGSTQFTMNKTTKPGDTLLVRIGLTALQEPGTYYTTYTLEAPSGEQFGELTSRFSVRGGRPSPTATPQCRWCDDYRPPHPGGPHGPWGPPPPPRW